MQSQAHAYTLALLATECTTPFVNLRFLLDKGGWRQHPAYTANGMALLFSWILGRIVLFVFFFHHVWLHLGEFHLVSTCPGRMCDAGCEWARVASSLLNDCDLPGMGRRPDGQRVESMPRWLSWPPCIDTLKLAFLPASLPPCPSPDEQITPLSRWLIYVVPPVLFTLNMVWFNKILRGALKLIFVPKPAPGGGTEAAPAGTAAAEKKDT